MRKNKKRILLFGCVVSEDEFDKVTSVNALVYHSLVEEQQLNQDIDLCKSDYDKPSKSDRVFFH